MPTIPKYQQDNEKESYGNAEVNELVDFLRARLEASLDGTQKGNRQHCWNLIRKFKKDYPHRDPIESIKLLINYGLQDDFHSKNITNFGYLYRNTQKIIQAVKVRRENYVAV